MGTFVPNRLLTYDRGKFSVIDAGLAGITQFDIISYTWGDTVDGWYCDIEGVKWKITLRKEKLNEIKRWMISTGVRYLWVDAVCLNQEDLVEKNAEITRMYQYYKSAHQCHILLDMVDVWKPQDIVDNLRYIGHIVYHMGGATIAAEARLTDNLTKFLARWGYEADWVFELDRNIVRSAAVEPGILNCYSTCINRVQSVFRHLYFSRVWTFQEMLLGKNIIMWGINAKEVSCIGPLETWMDLATDSKDKAFQLQGWIDQSRLIKPASVESILRIIIEDNIILSGLQTQVRGLSSARTDVMAGGPWWWLENHKGISNVFSAISIVPRRCGERRADIFKGLLGVFHGLFDAQEVTDELSGDDIDKISFAFFRQLSMKTGWAWTRLAISSGERAQWDWIPVIANSPKFMTTDLFSGIVRLGVLKKGKTAVKAQAVVGLEGSPRKYMRIALNQAGPGDVGFYFNFQGCNGGKKQTTGFLNSETISVNSLPRIISGDETGRTLTQCATVLGYALDPGCDEVEFRQRVLSKLMPRWNVSDPNAKPPNWVDRCVSGTFWERPDPPYFKSHNMSMNFKMPDLFDCGSRLQNDNMAKISCEVRVNCGCTITAPFALIFEAFTSLHGSSLGDKTGYLDQDNRIVLHDGLGLVQVGDIGKAFSVVAFEGDVHANASYASACRKARPHKPAVADKPWPRARALVREEFSHDMMDAMRDYGFVETGGSGNLLICRNNRMDDYRILGVCIDDKFTSKKGSRSVKIR